MYGKYKGLFASTTEKVIAPIFQLGISIVLARMIAPEMFGLFAMVQILILLATVFADGGLPAALIRIEKCNNLHYSTTFIYNLATAILLAIVLWFASEYIALFYGRYELVIIAKFLSFNVVTSSFCGVPRAILARDKIFGAISIASIVSILVGGTLSIVLASQGQLLNALLAFNLVPPIVTAMILLFYAKWLPRLEFSFKILQEEFSFSGHLLGMALFHVIFGNLYSVIIGKFFSASNLAFFARGSSLPMMTGGNISDGICQYFYSHYSAIRGDLVLLQKEYMQSLSLLVLLLAPILSGLALISPKLVPLIFTDKWSPSVPYLVILCAAVFFEGITSLSRKLLLAVGNSKFPFRLTLILSPLEIVTAVLVLYLTHSLIALCYTKVIFSALGTVIMTGACVKELRMSVSTATIMLSVFARSIPALVMCAGIMMFDKLFYFSEMYQNVFALIIVGVILYLLMMVVRYRKTIGVYLGVIRDNFSSV
jgi:teichuronic acid exporter